MSGESENLSNEQALRKFLSDISCLDDLEQRLGAFNIFDVLGMTRTEIRHSNVLAWLLDPTGTHGMGVLFLRSFLQCLSRNGADALELLTAPFNDFTVRREYKHIDILLVCKMGDKGIVVAIENKVDSGEHDNQLVRYAKTITEDFAGWHSAFVFLTPDGESASSEQWRPISYNAIRDMLRYCMARSNLSPKSDLLLRQYLELLEREFMKKDELAKICNKIYREHKQALDLIYEMREDPCAETFDMVCTWFKEHPDCGLDFDRDHSSKSYIRFTTSALLNVIPPLPAGVTSDWGSDKSAYYEIVNRSNGLTFKLSACSRNMPPQIAAKLKSVFELPEKSLSGDWRWKTLHRFPSVRLVNEDDYTPDVGDVDAFMEKARAEIVSYETKRFVADGAHELVK